MTGLVELLTKIGNDNMEYQRLGRCMTNIKSKKGEGSQVTFVTEAITPSSALSNTGKEALIIWVDKSVLSAAHKEVTGGGN